MNRTLTPCHPERPRASGANERKSKDPGAVCSAVQLQGARPKLSPSRNCSWLLAIVLAALLTSKAIAQTVPPVTDINTPKTAASAPALPISSGDLLDVQVFDTPELSAKLRVDSQGEITLPVGGAIKVQGLTAEQAATAIQARLLSTDVLKDPHVNVFILEYATQGVTVLGEVKNPGIYPLLGPHTLYDLVSAAGGVTPNAGKAVSITHRGASFQQPGQAVTVSMSNDPALAAKANLAIQPGDTIVVSRAGVVYVVGDVSKPGGFLIDNNDRLTVLQAIALAQGTNKTAKLNGARLIRKTATGREESDLKLKKILANKATDPQLEDGDIIFVPSSETKNFAYRGIEAAIQMTTGLVTYGRL
jgi:polysaccharide biosynthesis/export protein